GFAFLKSALQGVFTACGVAGVKTTAAEDERFAYGLGYEWKGKQLAVAGLLDRRLTEKAELAQDVFYAVTDWEALVKAASARTIVYREVPKFPAVRRDLALLLDRQVS